MPREHREGIKMAEYECPGCGEPCIGVEEDAGDYEYPGAGPEAARIILISECCGDLLVELDP